jgi:predicted TIM-barrel fold metal-dependent hydrolase
MGRFGFEVIDADGHIFESKEFFERLRDGYIESRFKSDLAEMMRLSTDPATGKMNTSRFWTHRSKEKALDRVQALGGGPAGPERPERGEGRKPGTRAVFDTLDARGRLLDMDDEGIDSAVVFPSAMIGFCALDSTELESALYRAYNRIMSDFCSADPKRLKYVAMFSQRDVEDGVAEIQRVSSDKTALGLYTQTHMDGKQLDDPSWYPYWEAAQDAGLAITVHHGSAGLPPWGLGVHEMGGNWFQQHASVFLYEQMRAVATVIGGGIADMYPKLPFAFLESGCGWLPFWLERLDEHFEEMPHFVPLLKRKPSEVFATGRCFISFEPDEAMLADVIEVMGDRRLVYASDYPHFDCRFPNSVRQVVENAQIGKAAKGRILEANARGLYPRLG